MRVRTALARGKSFCRRRSVYCRRRLFFHCLLSPGLFLVLIVMQQLAGALPSGSIDLEHLPGFLYELVCAASKHTWKVTGVSGDSGVQGPLHCPAAPPSSSSCRHRHLEIVPSCPRTDIAARVVRCGGQGGGGG